MHRKRRVVLAVLALLGLLLGLDLFGPRRHRMREFDPREVARLETVMWQSYYAKDRVALVNQAAELLRTQYGLPPVSSYVVAAHAARAAFVFKQGKNREDYEKALPGLIDLYGAMRRGSDIAFDVERAARLELEWWIIHRERARHTPRDLDLALAELAGEVYALPAERFLEHGRLRQEAMSLRDQQAARGGVTEEDWIKIELMLRESWTSLWNEIRRPDA